MRGRAVLLRYLTNLISLLAVNIQCIKLTSVNIARIHAQKPNSWTQTKTDTGGCTICYMGSEDFTDVEIFIMVTRVISPCSLARDFGCLEGTRETLPLFPYLSSFSIFLALVFFLLSSFNLFFLHSFYFLPSCFTFLSFLPLPFSFLFSLLSFVHSLFLLFFIFVRGTP
jgi:hypothetical protein